MKIHDAMDLNTIKEQYDQKLSSYKYLVYICGGAGCISSACGEVEQAANDFIQEHGLGEDVLVLQTGCMGTCAVGPVMIVQPSNTFYTKLTPETVKAVLSSHVLDGKILEKYTYYDSTLQRHVPNMDEIDFFKKQVKIALRNCGKMDHGSIEAYIARNGYQAAANWIKNHESGEVVDEIKRSGLKGRGGAGFPTGVKWEAAFREEGENKYIVCNADEGDPGAFMDRSLIEGDPHSLVEGMIIGGYAIGAKKGYVYVRAEYPLAVERLENAIAQAHEFHLLGENLFDTDFSFDLEIRMGAGAFVCGEETALLNSIEGKRGEPRQKPPFPFESGLHGCPTIINNVETLVNVPAIMYRGADWYAGIGTGSPGTKVFALAGDITNTGIVEVPIGMPLGDILFDIGGGTPNSKKFKAAQIGGPSGGCITPDQLNTPTDYDSLQKLGAIMGSGGLICMNEDACMVDTARFFMEFIQDESCGKCVACRIGTKRMLEILERITQGRGEPEDLDLLAELGQTVKDTAICGLGQTAPNPVLSAIQNFREEFEEHIKYKYCRAGVCSELFISPCENTCPANVNVPGYTALIAEGRFMDAYHLIRQENPFPAVCGRICTRPCESKCRRRTTDEAIAICDLKRFVADYAHKNEQPFVKDIFFPKNGKRVAIIGAGAAGLTCAHYLVRIGYDVDVFESEKVAGGVLAFGIPEYRLPMKVLMEEVNLIEREGVNIHLNTAVGKDVKFDELKRGYDAIFVATGTQIPQRVDISGESLDGVIHGINFLKMINLQEPFELGETVAVIGGGNTAVDSARSALRMGAKKVSILYRRTRKDMPAYQSEVREAIEEGVELIELMQPVRFVDDGKRHVKAVECTRMKLGDFDKDGRRRAVPDDEADSFLLPADTVVPAISQYADLPFIPAAEIGRTQWGTFTVDGDTMMTTIPGVFAGGDIVRGPDSVIQAIADGKLAAVSIDRYLGGKGILNKGDKIDFTPKYDDDEIVELPRYPLDMLDPDQRKNNFDEVVLGYHKLTAMAEAMRCLHCERR